MNYSDLVGFWSFADRPASLSPDLRPLWKVTTIILCLHFCARQKRATLKKLHVLNWAIRTRATGLAFLEVLDGKLNPDQMIVRYDPALNRALDFAIADGLISRQKSDRFQLTAHGQTLAEEVTAASDCMVTEKWLVQEIGTRASESAINKLLKTL